MIDLLPYALDRMARRESKAKMLGRYNMLSGSSRSNYEKDKLITDKETEDLYRERVEQYSPQYREQAYKQNERQFTNLAKSMVQDKYEAEIDPTFSNSMTDRNYERLIHDDKDQEHLTEIMSGWEMADVDQESSVAFEDNADMATSIIDRMSENEE